MLTMAANSVIDEKKSRSYRDIERRWFAGEYENIVDQKMSSVRNKIEDGLKGISGIDDALFGQVKKNRPDGPLESMPIHLPMLNAGSNLPATVGLCAFLVSLLTCSDK